MNTRLQVEHPVTEAITGIDLVEWQLRVASGEALPMAQEDVPLKGHAFEARLYAEDVPAGFLPATGRLTHLEFAPGVRVETGVRAGDAISPWYDPMIAKVIAEGPTRGAALNLLAQALENTEVAGTVTNLGFLARLARHEGFGRGEVDTGLIARDLAALTEQPPTPPEVVAVAAVTALGLDGARGWDGGFSLWEPLGHAVALDHRGERIEAVVRTLSPGRHVVEVSDEKTEIIFASNGWKSNFNHAGKAVMAGNTVTIFRHGAHVFTRHDPLEVERDEAGGNVALSPMPGLVKAVFVRAGQAVAKGDRLAVLEAMKMEHVLTAGRDGVVAEVLAAAGSQVEAGQPLVRLEETE